MDGGPRERGLFHFAGLCWTGKAAYIRGPFQNASMANHKSALKRVRQTTARNARNSYQHKTTRNAVRDLRATTTKKEAAEQLPAVSAMLDKLAKRNVIHKNKAANLKSSLTKHVSKLK